MLITLFIRAPFKGHLVKEIFELKVNRPKLLIFIASGTFSSLIMGNAFTAI